MLKGVVGIASLDFVAYCKNKRSGLELYRFQDTCVRDESTLCKHNNKEDFKSNLPLNKSYSVLHQNDILPFHM